MERGVVSPAEVIRIRQFIGNQGRAITERAEGGAIDFPGRGIEGARHLHPVVQDFVDQGVVVTFGVKNHEVRGRRGPALRHGDDVVGMPRANDLLVAPLALPFFLEEPSLFGFPREGSRLLLRGMLHLFRSGRDQHDLDGLWLGVPIDSIESSIRAGIPGHRGHSVNSTKIPVPPTKSAHLQPPEGCSMLAEKRAIRVLESETSHGS